MASNKVKSGNGNDSRRGTNRTCTVSDQSAPDFCGTAVINGIAKEIKLSNYKGKYLVLIFYPMDFYYVCLTEIIAFSERIHEFKCLNCEIVACSTDSDLSHCSWLCTDREHGGVGQVNFPLLADKNCRIAKDYGVLNEAEGIAFRATFVIDDKGRIRQSTINDVDVGRCVEEVLRSVRAFQQLKRTREECPMDSELDELKPKIRRKK
ncbi:peroxiredoxin 2-like [Centruroides vittatus]|uniref:peroxiredoxin 2-like n=1 Tax=Centruroides vittatus TaxID=120091 RepID=UPI003510B88B